MEYSLKVLNEINNLNSMTIKEVVNELNLLGFEVDQIFWEKAVDDNYLENVRLMIKIPANREDLFSERFFLKDMANIFGLKVYNPSKLYKQKYLSIFSRKNKSEDHLRMMNLPVDLKDILMFQIQIKDLNPSFSPFWIQTKLKNAGIKVTNSIEDVLLLINLEFGHKFEILDLEKNPNLSLIQNQEQKTDSSQTIFKPLVNIPYVGIENVLKYATRVENGKLDFPDSVIALYGLFYDIDINSHQLTPSREVSTSLRKSFYENYFDALKRILSIFVLGYSAKIIPISYLKCDKKIIPEDNLIEVKIKNIKNFLNIDPSQLDLNVFERASIHLIGQTQTSLFFKISHNRRDLKREIDLIEEYGRFFGYENFTELYPIPVSKSNLKKKKMIPFLKNFMSNSGYSEVVAKSAYGWDTIKDSSVIIQNPVSEDFYVLQNELISNLVVQFETAYKLTGKILNLYEIGRVFNKFQEVVNETDKLAGIFQLKLNILHDQNELEWLEAKGYLENILNLFNYPKKDIIFENWQNRVYPTYFKDFHKKRSCEIKVNSRVIGIFGQLDPKKEKIIGTKNSTYLFECDLSYFETWQIETQVKPYKEYSKYPLIIKDFSMFITKEVCFWALKQDLKKTSELVKEIEIFDIYRTDFDDPKKQNSIAIGMRIEFQSMTKSLLNQEIEKEVKKIEEVLISKYDVTFK